MLEKLKDLLLGVLPIFLFFVSVAQGVPTYSGGNGLCRVLTAGGERSTLGLGLYGEVFLKEMNYPEGLGGYIHREGTSRFSFSYQPATFWEFYGQSLLRNHYDSPPKSQPWGGTSDWGMGDPTLGCKFFFPVNPDIIPGFSPFISFPWGNEELPLGDQKTTPFNNGAVRWGTSGILTMDLTQRENPLPFKIHFNFGYLVNQKRLAGRPANWNNLLLFGIGTEYIKKNFRPFLEFTTEQAIHNKLLYSSMNPIRVTPGFRLLLLSGFHLDLALDLGISQKLKDHDISAEGFGAGYKEGDKLVPDWNLLFGLSYTFSLRKFPPQGILLGTIYDKKTNEAVPATISFLETDFPEIKNENRTGLYRVKLPRGMYKIRVSSPGYRWQQVSLQIEEEEVRTVNFALNKKSITPEEEEKSEKIKASLQSQIDSGFDYLAKDSLFQAVEVWEKSLKEFQGLLATTKNEMIQKIAPYREQALSSSKAGRILEAIEGWKAVLSFNPKDQEARDSLLTLSARGEKLAGRTEKPRRVLPRESKIMESEKKKKMEEELKVLYQEGIRLFNNEEYKKAKSVWEKLLRLDPTNERAKSYLKKTENRLKKLEELKRD